MLKVALSGIYYPMAMLHYFRRALQRMEQQNQLKLFTAGIFTGNRIPWNNGMTIAEKYVFYPDVWMSEDLLRQRTSPNFQLIASEVTERQDVWIQVDAGFHFGNRPDADVVLGVITDPHAISVEHYNNLRENCDFTFCMQTPYQQTTDYYLPYAYDPTVHYYEPDRVKFKPMYDMTIMGLQYDLRRGIADELKKRKYHVLNTIGSVYDEYRIIYNHTKVGLNVSSLNDLPARVFEYAAMGVPILTNTDIPDLGKFFEEDTHFKGFIRHTKDIDTVFEAVKVFEGMMENYDGMVEMAGRAKEHNKDNTYDNRVKSMFEVAEVTL